MKKLAYSMLLSIVFCGLVFAAQTESKKNEIKNAIGIGTNVNVVVLDKNVDTKSLKDEKVNVYRPEKNDVRETNSEILSPEVRDKIFKEAGLQKEIQNMDNLDKDMLVARARVQTFNRLTKIYNKISKEKLKKLQNTIPKYLK